MNQFSPPRRVIEIPRQNFSLLDPRHLRDPQSRGIGRRQRHARLEAGDRFEETNDLLAAEHRRQLARLAGVGDPLWDRLAAERHAIEEAQRTDDLVERRPGDPRGRQMNLKGLWRDNLSEGPYCRT